MERSKVRLLYENGKEVHHYVTEDGNIQVMKCGCWKPFCWKYDTNRSKVTCLKVQCPVCGYLFWRRV